MRPYNTVEKPAFSNIVNALNSSYSVPGRKRLPDSLIPKLYNETHEVIEHILYKVTDVSLMILS